MWASRIVFGLLALVMISVSIAAFISQANAKKVGAYIAQPKTSAASLGVGDAVRLGGIIEGKNEQTSLYGQKPCVAYWSVVERCLEHRESDGETETEHEAFVDERKGPKMLTFNAKGWSIRLSRELWVKLRGGLYVANTEKLPAHVPKPPPATSGYPCGFRVNEVVLAKGAPIFVAGLVKGVDAEAKILEIDEDPMLDQRVELVAGTHRDLVAVFQKSAQGLLIIGFVFVALALLFVTLLFVYERKAARG